MSQQDGTRDVDTDDDGVTHDDGADQSVDAPQFGNPSVSFAIPDRDINMWDRCTRIPSHGKYPAGEECPFCAAEL